MAVIGSLGGGGIGAYLMYRINSRKVSIEEKAVNNEEFKELLAIYKDDNQLLRKRVDDLENRERNNTQRITEMENQLLLLESSHHDLPLPQWLKDLSGRMLSINAAYESIFLLPLGLTAKDYIGKTDEEVWGSEIAKKFREADREALKNNEPTWSVEPVLEANGEIGKWKIVKYPRRAGRTVVGIGGIGINRVDDQFD